MEQETEALIGSGTQFAIATNPTAPDTFTDIAEVTNVTPPSFQTDVVEATHMESPDKVREYILGLTDPGEASFEMNFIPGSASDSTIQSVHVARKRVRCRVTFPTTADSPPVEWTFSGLLTNYEPAAPQDDKMTATVTFKVTGSILTGVDDSGE